MPGGLFEADTSFPNLEGKSTEQQLKAIESYLYQLLESLRWTLNNLSSDNFNVSEVNGWLGETITKPIQAEITGVADDLSALETRVGIDETGISTLVSKTGINSLGTGETLYSRIDQTAGEIRSEVSQVTEITVSDWATGMSYAVGTFVAVSNGSTTGYYKCTAAHTSSNANKPGTTGGAAYWEPIPAQNALATQVSTVSQTADAIMAQVTDENNDWAVLTLKSDGLHIGDEAGTTTISGDSITSGTITGVMLKSLTQDREKIVVVNNGEVTIMHLGPGDTEVVDGYIRREGSGVVGQADMLIGSPCHVLISPDNGLRLGQGNVWGTSLPTIEGGEESENNGRIFFLIDSSS